MTYSLGSSENGMLPRPRKPSAHEAGRLPRDRKELCFLFVNEKVYKTFDNTMRHGNFFSLGICISRVHCIAMASIRSAEEQPSNPLTLSGFSFYWDFSLRNLPTLPFSECVFFLHFVLRSLRSLPFSECVFFWHFFSAKSAGSTVF